MILGQASVTVPDELVDEIRRRQVDAGGQAALVSAAILHGLEELSAGTFKHRERSRPLRKRSLYASSDSLAALQAALRKYRFNRSSFLYSALVSHFEKTR